MSRPAIIDTNVLVSGLITDDPQAAPARIVDAMLAGQFRYLLSVELLAEYRQVLLRPKIVLRHGLSAAEVDIVLAAIAERAVLRATHAPAINVPDPNDRHVWSLLWGDPSAILVTGDKALLDAAPPARSVLSPAAFLGWLAEMTSSRH